MNLSSEKWWKNAVIYEIFPRSFKDSNNDGVGDLKGILSKLDYLKELGIDALWLCPVYSTPNVDGGYDVSDYYALCSELGTMEDFDELIEQAHHRQIKIVMELIANHTSDAHYWFQDAKSSKKSKYRDYYIWKEEKAEGKCPNNWISSKTGSSVWSKTDETDEYYLHLYTESQPDLNWENKEVRDEIYKIMKFWFDKGVDGFRMDVINKIAKAPGLPDLIDGEPYFYAERYFENQPHVHYYLHEMYQEVMLKYPDRLTMGQTSGVTPEQALLYTEPNRKELNLFLQFDHVDCDRGPQGRKLSFEPSVFKDMVFKWQKKSKLWNTIFFGSHDLARMVSHYGNDGVYHKESAKMLATIQLLLRGTPIIYMGDEIGMTNVNYDDIKDYRDNRSQSIYRERVFINGEEMKKVLSDIQALGRDNARYPMQWDRSLYGGFSSTKPWMKVNKNYDKINVSDQENDVYSILSYYKKLIRLRKSEPAITHGLFEPIYEDDETLFAYRRIYGDIEVVVVANMSMSKREMELDYLGECILCNYEDIEEGLRAYEVRVFKSLKSNP